MRLMPDEIIDEYNLKRFEHGGWVYIKIVKGLYGLPQAGKIANELLQKRLKMYGYHPVQFTPGLWTHIWRPVSVPGYVDSTLDQFGHKPPAKPRHSPTIAQPMKYGQKIQKATPIDTSAKLSKKGIERIQKNVDAFAWYAGATDPNMSKP